MTNSLNEIEKTRELQLAALGRAVKHYPPGPHVPTWPYPIDAGIISGIAIGTSSALPTCTPPVDPLLTRRVVSFDPPDYARGSALTRADGETPRYARLAALVPGRTVAAAMRAGVTRRDVLWAVREGYLNLSPVHALEVTS